MLHLASRLSSAEAISEAYHAVVTSRGNCDPWSEHWLVVGGSQDVPRRPAKARMPLESWSEISALAAAYGVPPHAVFKDGEGYENALTQNLYEVRFNKRLSLLSLARHDPSPHAPSVSSVGNGRDWRGKLLSTNYNFFPGQSTSTPACPSSRGCESDVVNEAVGGQSRAS